MSSRIFSVRFLFQTSSNHSRVLAIFILVYQGSFALGSAVWGGVAQRFGIQIALASAGIGTIATIGMVLFARLPASAADLSPWNHWRMPVVVKEDEADLQEGPVLVTVKYSVIPDRKSDFVEAIQELGRIRRRDGAYRWGIYRDTEDAHTYLEIFLVRSWAEHMRQHDRQTQADRKIELRLLSYLNGETVVHHLVYAHSKES